MASWRNCKQFRVTDPNCKELATRGKGTKREAWTRAGSSVWTLLEGDEEEREVTIVIGRLNLDLID